MEGALFLSLFATALVSILVSAQPVNSDETSLVVALGQCADGQFDSCDQVTEHLAYFPLRATDENAISWVEAIDAKCQDESVQEACDAADAVLLHAPEVVPILRRREAAMAFQDRCEAGERQHFCALHAVAIMRADRLGFLEFSQQKRLFGATQAFARACTGGNDLTCTRLNMLRTQSLSVFPEMCAGGDDEACEIAELLEKPTWLTDLVTAPTYFEFSEG